MANTPQIRLYNEKLDKWDLPDAGRLYDSLYGSYTAYDVFMLQRDVAGLLSDKADKKDIPKKTSDLENDSGYITLRDVPKVDLTDIQNQLNGKAHKYHAHYATDILTSSSGKTQEVLNKETKESVDVLEAKLLEKSDKSHMHTKSDVAGLDSDIKSIWTAVNGKAFTDHTHMPGDVYINHSGDKLSDISAKHIDYDGWDTVDDKLKSLQSQITGLDIPDPVDLTEINKEIHDLQLEKANKTEIPTKLSQLEQDIDMGSNFIIPRTTNTPKINEITVHETPKKSFQLSIRSMSEGVKQDGNVFNFDSGDGYSSLDFEVISGAGVLVGAFSDTSGYYSYTHRKINRDRDESGWVKGDKTISIDVGKGDEFRISTGGSMKFELDDIPTTMEKVLYFNNEAINKETDLTQVYSDIGDVKSQLGYKADKNHKHDEYMKVEDALITTGYSLPTPGVSYRGKIFTLFGDTDIPYICLKIKGTYKWQRLAINGAVWDDFR